MTSDRPADGAKIRAGTAEYRRATAALFASGFTIFALLYSVQPLLPEFSKEFGVSPAESSLALSLTTGVLALAMLVASSVSEVIGRRKVMLAALVSSSLATLALAFVPGWTQILALRAVTGLALSGLPAVAMAYLVDEVEASAVGRAMGLYVGGSALGGMSGRVAVAVITDHGSWRMGLAAMGAIGLVSAAMLWRFLPPSRNFTPSRPDLAALVRSMLRHLRDPGLLLLFAEGFLLMGAFVTLYNYIGYRLLGPPYGLSQTAVGLIFTGYILGTLSSAWMGGLADRFGRRRVLWAAILVMGAGILATLSGSLPVIIAGIAVSTFGFFGAHSIASSWVGLRAEGAKAQASSLYLLAYYLGSSLAGFAGGFLWQGGGWPAVVAGIGALVALALLLALALAGIAPPKWMRRQA